MKWSVDNIPYIKAKRVERQGASHEFQATFQWPTLKQGIVVDGLVMEIAVEEFASERDKACYHRYIGSQWLSK